MDLSSLRSPMLLLTVLAAACQETTGLKVTRPPDFTARVTQSTYENGISPEGQMSQYAVWLAVPPSDTANASLGVASSAPVYLSAEGMLRRASASDIRAGDEVVVWRESAWAVGCGDGPPGAACYFASQVEIVR